MGQQKVWTEEYKITSYLVNLQGRAGLYPMLNLIQDVGWQHATHLEIKIDKNLGWVFTRQKLVMKEWPHWNQNVRLVTWLRPPSSGSFLFRDYEIFIDDKKIGECTSTFAVMDLKARKLSQQDWSQYPQIWHAEKQLQNEAVKIPAQKEVQDLIQFQVRNSDIDLNQHVNNTKYAQWILDSIPMNLLVEGPKLHEYQVNFLAEAKSEDVIQIQKVVEEPVQDSKRIIQFQGVRTADQKLIFTAQLHIAD